MINDKELIKKLKVSLNRERTYKESQEKEEVFETFIEQLIDVDIYYIYSNQYLNSVKFIEDKAFIIWDFSYWDIFKHYLLQVENCKKNGKNIIQGIIGVMSDYLGEKYIKYPPISIFLKSIQATYGIPLELPEEYLISIAGKVNICKIFSLFHEIGHLEYVKISSNRIAACKELVLDLFNALSQEDFEDLGIWSDLSWKTVDEIRRHKKDSILEEITVDVFGIMLVADYYKNNIKRSNFQLSCDIVVAIEYLTTFQNLFNVVNKAWDAHFAEIKYNLPLRKHEIDNAVNEIEVARNGVGNLILVIVIKCMFHLNERQSQLLWKYRDENHIDNREVISCLADEDFICTAIEEAIK